jgi:hypothetical protein
MKRENSKELESAFVKSIATELIYTYKNLSPFKNIEPNDILFIRDENLKTTFSKPIEIYVADSVTMAISEISFIVLISTEFDNLTKDEQYRRVFHILCHIPNNYKEQRIKDFKITLIPHSIEIFEQESEFIQDLKKKEEDIQKKENQVNLRRTHLIE